MSRPEFTTESAVASRDQQNLCKSLSDQPVSARTLAGLTGKCALLVLIAASSIPRSRALSPELPDGPMQEKVATACTECHSSRIIIQQRLSKEAWIKEVDKMIKWGALVAPADHDKFVDYLSSNFPPDKTPDPPLRVPVKER